MVGLKAEGLLIGALPWEFRGVLEATTSNLALLTTLHFGINSFGSMQFSQYYLAHRQPAARKRVL